MSLTIYRQLEMRVGAGKLSKTADLNYSMHKYVSILRSRLPVIAGVAVVALAILVGTYTRGSVSGAWQMLRVPALSPLFADTRTMTHSIDCLLSGQDPYTVRSFDPWNRTYNYPPIWLDLRFLGVTSHSSILLGMAFAVMTISAFLLLLRTQIWASSAIIFFAVTSRSVLFAIERGNTDEVIFFLLVFSFFVIGRLKPEVRTFLNGTLIVLLTVLKIFPVAAVVSLVRNRKDFLVALLCGVLSVAALVATSEHRLPQIMANTPQDTFISFGSLPFFVAIFTHTSHFLLGIIQHHPKSQSLGAVLLAFLCVIAGTSYREKLNRFLPPLDFNQTRGSIAVAGLAIFAVAFLRGSSYDYRLIFLLGAIAYLVEDLNESKSLRSLPAAILFVALLWKSPDLSLIYEIVDGFVYAIACAWLGTSLLDNLQIVRVTD